MATRSSPKESEETIDKEQEPSVPEELKRILNYILQAIKINRDEVVELEDSIGSLIEDYDTSIDDAQEQLFGLSAQVTELRAQLNQMRAIIQTKADKRVSRKKT